MFQSLEIFVFVLSIIAVVAMVFRKFTVPLSLILVITGMLFSYIPYVPKIAINQDLILDVFLPLLIYEISSEISWRDIKHNMRPILLLSIGHVFFITFLVAWVIHGLIPQLSWPVAIILGAVISPPDDVAVVSIAEKIHMPSKVVTILKSEGMLNDAAALILFRFALVALLTHHFSPVKAFSAFLLIIVAETLYGLVLGYVLGRIRLTIQDPKLQMLLSLLTPFLAYLPAERLGGCGILATAVTGLVMGHQFLDNFSAPARLSLLNLWPTLSFILQNIIFLLVGLDLRFILQRISHLPMSLLVTYSLTVILTVIVGRFVWIYGTLYLPDKWLRKKSFPWQYPIIISWAGMRGGISLAAALAVPSLSMAIDGVNLRDFVVFLVFVVILATLLVQGFTLPALLKWLKIPGHRQRERFHEQHSELLARFQMAKAVVRWLKAHRKNVSNDPELIEEFTLHLRHYENLQRQLENELQKYKGGPTSEAEAFKLSAFSLEIIEVERKELARLWREEKISHAVSRKLLLQLDYRTHHFN